MNLNFAVPNSRRQTDRMSVKPVARTVSRLLWGSRLIVAVLTVSSTSLSADSFYHVLQQPCRVQATALPVSELIKSLSQSHGINIWLDRRIDPNRPIDLPAGTETTAQAIELIASQCGAEVGYAEPIAFIAPPGAAINAATDLLRLRLVLKQLSNQKTRDLMRPADIQWPRLSSPADIGRVIADQWKIDLSTDGLPHDLWDAKNLQSIDVSAALVLLGSGFSQSPVFEPTTGRFSFQPTEPGLSVAIDYPATKISAAILASLRTIDPRLNLEKVGGLVRVQATATVHHALRMSAVAANRRPSQAVVADVAPMQRRFTLRIPGEKPAAAVLQAICKASGLSLDTSAAAADRLNAPVNLDVADQPVAEILQSVCRQAGLSVSFEDQTAVVVNEN